MSQSISDPVATGRHARVSGGNELGSTMVELMVVLILVGVLVAIAIPTFLNQRQQAWTASVKSDLVSASIAAESYAASNKGSYLNLTKALLVMNGFKETLGNSLVVGATSETTYVFTDSNGNLSTTWTSMTGVVTPG